MSLPHIPNITPPISLTRSETINLLLASIAQEEIGLAHILKAEGETFRKVMDAGSSTLKDCLQINESLNRTLRSVVKSQMLLHFKLEDVLLLDAANRSEGKPQ
ncbi:hypothetical protein J9317_03750 [Metabacillus sp. KIGAM252]|uniref:Uncharacterized protein n=1 Tax=Metabacillus flavus TaxID=2823519 RepID=A0ABS5LB71_9BACI|nr:hypothetical protein [Metabacillus flavus]MBS2967889.1 hypothetical protein [Metabacillus flavus]